MITFLDACSGIGGSRLGLEWLGWKCVGFSEIDVHVTTTYKDNFNVDGELELGDIRKVDGSKLPNFDVLIGGFPCQPFSACGKRLGFEDVRGTLFFHLARVVRESRPRAFILENVKGITNHDDGKTFDTILNLLGKTINHQRRLGLYEDCLKYDVFWSILNSRDFGVPQNRERVFIVGFDENVSFEFPKPISLVSRAYDLLEKNVDEKYDLNPTPSRKKIIEESIKINDVDICRTITTKQDRIPNAGIVKKENGWYRYLTPRECARLQGFPNSFKLPTNDTIAYKQIGNAIIAENTDFGKIRSELKREVR